jgi:hypothetical protein
MAAKLPPSWFKMTGSLSSLRRLMGWQVLGLAPKLKHGVALLANMRPGDCLLCSVCPGWVGVAAVLLLPHAAVVLRAPAATPLFQLHYAGGHLCPPL